MSTGKRRPASRRQPPPPAMGETALAMEERLLCPLPAVVNSNSSNSHNLSSQRGHLNGDCGRHNRGGVPGSGSSGNSTENGHHSHHHGAHGSSQSSSNSSSRCSRSASSNPHQTRARRSPENRFMLRPREMHSRFVRKDGIVLPRPESPSKMLADRSSTPKVKQSVASTSPASMPLVRHLHHLEALSEETLHPAQRHSRGSAEAESAMAPHFSVGESTGCKHPSPKRLAPISPLVPLNPASSTVTDSDGVPSFHASIRSHLQLQSSSSSANNNAGGYHYGSGSSAAMLTSSDTAVSREGGVTPTTSLSTSAGLRQTSSSSPAVPLSATPGVGGLLISSSNFAPTSGTPDARRLTVVSQPSLGAESAMYHSCDEKSTTARPSIGGRNSSGNTTATINTSGIGSSDGSAPLVARPPLPVAPSTAAVESDDGGLDTPQPMPSTLPLPRPYITASPDEADGIQAISSGDNTVPSLSSDGASHRSSSDATITTGSIGSRGASKPTRRMVSRLSFNFVPFGATSARQQRCTQRKISGGDGNGKGDSSQSSTSILRTRVSLLTSANLSIGRGSAVAGGNRGGSSILAAAAPAVPPKAMSDAMAAAIATATDDKSSSLNNGLPMATPSVSPTPASTPNPASADSRSSLLERRANLVASNSNVFRSTLISTTAGQSDSAMTSTAATLASMVEMEEMKLPTVQTRVDAPPEVEEVEANPVRSADTPAAVSLPLPEKCVPDHEVAGDVSNATEDAAARSDGALMEAVGPVASPPPPPLSASIPAAVQELKRRTPSIYEPRSKIGKRHSSNASWRWQTSSSTAVVVPASHEEGGSKIFEEPTGSLAQSLLSLDSAMYSPLSAHSPQGERNVACGRAEFRRKQSRMVDPSDPSALPTGSPIVVAPRSRRFLSMSATVNGIPRQGSMHNPHSRPDSSTSCVDASFHTHRFVSNSMLTVKGNGGSSSATASQLDSRNGSGSGTRRYLRSSETTDTASGSVLDLPPLSARNLSSVSEPQSQASTTQPMEDTLMDWRDEPLGEAALGAVSDDIASAGTSSSPSGGAPSTQETQAFPRFPTSSNSSMAPAFSAMPEMALPSHGGTASPNIHGLCHVSSDDSTNATHTTTCVFASASVSVNDMAGGGHRDSGGGAFAGLRLGPSNGASSMEWRSVLRPSAASDDAAHATINSDTPPPPPPPQMLRVPSAPTPPLLLAQKRLPEVPVDDQAVEATPNRATEDMPPPPSMPSTWGTTTSAPRRASAVKVAVAPTSSMHLKPDTILADLVRVMGEAQHSPDRSDRSPHSCNATLPPTGGFLASSDLSSPLKDPSSRRANNDYSSAMMTLELPPSHNGGWQRLEPAPSGFAAQRMDMTGAMGIAKRPRPALFTSVVHPSPSFAASEAVVPEPTLESRLLHVGPTETADDDTPKQEAVESKAEIVPESDGIISAAITAGGSSSLHVGSTLSASMLDSPDFYSSRTSSTVAVVHAHSPSPLYAGQGAQICRMLAVAPLVPPATKATLASGALGTWGLPATLHIDWGGGVAKMPATQLSGPLAVLANSAAKHRGFKSVLRPPEETATSRRDAPSVWKPLMESYFSRSHANSYSDRLQSFISTPRSARTSPAASTAVSIIDPTPDSSSTDSPSARASIRRASRWAPFSVQGDRQSRSLSSASPLSSTTDAAPPAAESSGDRVPLRALPMKGFTMDQGTAARLGAHVFKSVLEASDLNYGGTDRPQSSSGGIGGGGGASRLGYRSTAWPTASRVPPSGQRLRVTAANHPSGGGQLESPRLSEPRRLGTVVLLDTPTSPTQPQNKLSWAPRSPLILPSKASMSNASGELTRRLGQSLRGNRSFKALSSYQSASRSVSRSGDTGLSADLNQAASLHSRNLVSRGGDDEGDDARTNSFWIPPAPRGVEVTGDRTPTKGVAGGTTSASFDASQALSPLITSMEFPQFHSATPAFLDHCYQSLMSNDRQGGGRQGNGPVLLGLDGAAMPGREKGGGDGSDAAMARRAINDARSRYSSFAGAAGSGSRIPSPPPSGGRSLDGGRSTLSSTSGGALSRSGVWNSSFISARRTFSSVYSFHQSRGELDDSTVSELFGSNVNSDMPSHSMLPSMLYIPAELRNGSEWRQLQQRLANAATAAAATSPGSSAKQPTNAANSGPAAASSPTDDRSDSPAALNSPAANGGGRNSRSPTQQSLTPSISLSPQKMMMMSSAAGSIPRSSSQHYSTQGISSDGRQRSSRAFPKQHSYKILSYNIGMPISCDQDELSLVSDNSSATDWTSTVGSVQARSIFSLETNEMSPSSIQNSFFDVSSTPYHYSVSSGGGVGVGGSGGSGAGVGVGGTVAGATPPSGGIPSTGASPNLTTSRSHPSATDSGAADTGGSLPSSNGGIVVSMAKVAPISQEAIKSMEPRQPVATNTTTSAATNPTTTTATTTATTAALDALRMMAAPAAYHPAESRRQSLLSPTLSQRSSILSSIVPAPTPAPVTSASVATAVVEVLPVKTAARSSLDEQPPLHPPPPPAPQEQQQQQQAAELGRSSSKASPNSLSANGISSGDNADAGLGGSPLQHLSVTPSASSLPRGRRVYRKKTSYPNAVSSDAFESVDDEMLPATLSDSMPLKRAEATPTAVVGGASLELPGGVAAEGEKRHSSLEAASRLSLLRNTTSTGAAAAGSQCSSPYIDQTPLQRCLAGGSSSAGKSTRGDASTTGSPNAAPQHLTGSSPHDSYTMSGEALNASNGSSMATPPVPYHHLPYPPPTPPPATNSTAAMPIKRLASGDVNWRTVSNGAMADDADGVLPRQSSRGMMIRPSSTERMRAMLMPSRSGPTRSSIDSVVPPSATNQQVQSPLPHPPRNVPQHVSRQASTLKPAE